MAPRSAVLLALLGLLCAAATVRADDTNPFASATGITVDNSSASTLGSGSVRGPWIEGGGH